MSVFLIPVLMVLASYRLTRLIVKDDFPPMLWIRDRLAGGWRPLTAREHEAPAAVVWRNQTQEIDGVLSRYVVRASWSPHWMSELITCPWCASAYVSGAVVGGTWALAGLPVPLLMWGAVWGATALLASREWA